MGGNAALITPPLAAHDCEIPAFAGMVYLGTGNCGRILAILHIRHCEIPAFAGMVLWGDGELAGGFWRLCGHDTVRFLPSQEWST